MQAGGEFAGSVRCKNKTQNSAGLCQPTAVLCELTPARRRRVAGLDALVAAGRADPNRLAVMVSTSICAPESTPILSPGRAGTSPVNAVVRETILEWQVHFQSSD